MYSPRRKLVNLAQECSQNVVLPRVHFAAVRSSPFIHSLVERVRDSRSKEKTKKGGNNRRKNKGKNSFIS